MFLTFSRIAVVLCLFLAVPGKASAQPLTLVSAVWPCEADNVTVTFNQPVDPSTATNSANYAINQGITVDMVMMGSQPTFCLLPDWRNVTLKLCLRADDWAEVFLNNILIATTPNPSFNTANPTCVTVTNQSLFVHEPASRHLHGE